MNKNVTVLDESGNEIGATYFKRARGLVKKGRARFVSDTAIRLACPPSYNDEEDKMQNNITEAIEKTEEIRTEKATEDMAAAAAEDVAGAATENVAEEAEAEDIKTEDDSGEPADQGDAVPQADSPADPLREKVRLLEKFIDMYENVAITNGYTADDMSDTMNAILDGIRNL